MSDSDENRIALLMYESLRDEIDQSNELQNRIVFGQAVLVGVGVGVSTVVRVGSLSVPEYVLSVGLGALPVLVVTSTAAWLLEQARVMRAGNYLSGVENHLTLETNNDLVLWETWLRSDRAERHDAHNDEQNGETDTSNEEEDRRNEDDSIVESALKAIRGGKLFGRNEDDSIVESIGLTDPHTVYDIAFVIGYPVYFVTLGFVAAALGCRYGNGVTRFVSIVSALATLVLSYLAYQQITHSAHRV